MAKSGRDGREERDEISLIAEELVQLSVKGSTVVPSEKRTLICTIWTEKLYNPKSFRAQMKSIWKTKKKFEIQMAGQNLFLIVFDFEEDLEMIMEGRPWLSKINGDLCHLKINLDVQKPLRRGGSEVLALKGKLIKEGNNTNGMLLKELELNDVEEKMKKKEEVSTLMEDVQMNDSKNKQDNCSTRKRKSLEDEIENCCKEEAYEDGIKRLKKEGKKVCGESLPEEMIETMEQSNVPQFMGSNVRRSCGFLNGIDIEAEGSRGGLCLAWKEDIIVILRSFSKNHIDAMVKEKNTNEEWRFTGFYGSPYVNNKNDSWNLLRKLGEDQSHPWLLRRDFNEIMYSFEKSGGILREERKMEAFRETLEECQLEDIGYLGV
ncbi:hypothetical protein CXB51_010696 [Gossypium anomalum]|uniref:DUF4283 domain-containing protein n=1 Tax=Gossypium anomalum TaxID=47600 RepID=A0A8J5YNA1_9ROSI|nr:hypothetical protein CXB51_010696 [Gossypium anomalum]